VNQHAFGVLLTKNDGLRLEEIHRKTTEGNVILALYGVNHFPESLTRKLIVAGAVKISVNRDIVMDYYNHLEQRINKVPFTQSMEEGLQKVAEPMARHMDIVLSSGKA
jgi:fructose-bisphosphate aldolase, class II